MQTNEHLLTESFYIARRNDLDSYRSHSRSDCRRNISPSWDLGIRGTRRSDQRDPGPDSRYPNIRHILHRSRRRPLGRQRRPIPKLAHGHRKRFWCWRQPCRCRQLYHTSQDSSVRHSLEWCVNRARRYLECVDVWIEQRCHRSY